MTSVCQKAGCLGAILHLFFGRSGEEMVTYPYRLRDDFLDRAFAATGLPLLRIPAQRSYNTREIAEKIVPYLDGSISPTVTPAPMPGVANKPIPPTCPKCGSYMVLRTGTKGTHQGEDFYGCANYPKCRTILPILSSK